MWLDADVLRTDRFRIGDTDVSEDPDGLYPLLPGGLLLGVGEGLAELELRPGYSKGGKSYRNTDNRCKK